MPTLLLDIDESGFRDHLVATLTRGKVDFHHAVTTAVKSGISKQLEKLVSTGVCLRYVFKHGNLSGIVSLHRRADTFRWHRSGQDYLSSCGTRSSQQGARAEEVQPEPAPGLHREHAGVSDRAGGLRRSAFSWTCTAQARSSFIKLAISSTRSRG